MKKKTFLIYTLIIAISFALFLYAYADQNTSPDKISVKSTTRSDLIKGTYALSMENLPAGALIKQNFNMVIIESQGTRISKIPYRTDFNQQKSLENKISLAKAAGLNYMISLDSGPGLSYDLKTQSLFKRKYEARYFARMCIEETNRFKSDNNFKGILINLHMNDVPDAQYYSTVSLIQSYYYSQIKSLPLIISLHPAAFEDEFKDVPYFTGSYVMINASIILRGMSYPGFGAGIRTSYSLNKNTLLSTLQKLKDYETKTGHRVILSIKLPWVQNSNIMLQDFFELNRIFKLDYVLYCNNSPDIFNYRKNSEVMKVIERQR